jgi:hypothetical protein
MDNIEKIMYDFQNKGHPLGKGYSECEISDLVSCLKQRLNVIDDVLDLEPKSLNTLAKLLLDYYQKMTENGHIFSDEEVAQVVREIAAYIGKVILIHTKSVWIFDAEKFSYTRLDIDTPTIGKKGNYTKYSSSRSIFLAYPASRTWSAIQMGIEPKLYNLYKTAVSKVIKEKL